MSGSEEIDAPGLDGLDHRGGDLRRAGRRVSTGSTTGVRASGGQVAWSRQARPPGQGLRTGAAILRPLGEHGIRYTESSGWLALDAHERALGDADESAVLRALVKVVPRDEQVSIAALIVLVRT